jgi:hypothetical protein
LVNGTGVSLNNHVHGYITSSGTISRVECSASDPDGGFVLITDPLDENKIIGWNSAKAHALWDQPNSSVIMTIGDGEISWLNSYVDWATVFRESIGAAPAGRTHTTFTALHNQPPASNFATLDTRNSIAVLDFDDTTEESAVFIGCMPDVAALTSGIVVRIQWMATSATSGNCRWGVQFEKMTTDLDSDSFDTATEAHSATNATAGIPTITTLTCTSIDSITAGDFFRMKIYRDVSDTVNDTMTGDAELISVEVRSVL